MDWFSRYFEVYTNMPFLTTVLSIWLTTYLLLVVLFVVSSFRIHLYKQWSRGKIVKRGLIGKLLSNNILYSLGSEEDTYLFVTKDETSAKLVSADKLLLHDEAKAYVEERGGASNFCALVSRSGNYTVVVEDGDFFGTVTRSYRRSTDHLFLKDDLKKIIDKGAVKVRVDLLALNHFFIMIVAAFAAGILDVTLFNYFMQTVTVLGIVGLYFAVVYGGRALFDVKADLEEIRKGSDKPQE